MKSIIVLTPNKNAMRVTNTSKKELRKSNSSSKYKERGVLYDLVLVIELLLDSCRNGGRFG